MEASHSRGCLYIYTFRFIVPSILWRAPIPFAEKASHTITEPPPRFIVGSWYLGSKRLPLGCRIHLIPSLPNNINLLSSFQTTSDHCWGVQLRCAFVHSIRAFRFFAEISGFFTGRPCSPAACRRRRTVRTDGLDSPTVNISFIMSDAVRRGLLRAVRRILRSTTEVVQRGRPVFFFLT